MSNVIETQQSCPNFSKLKSELINHQDGIALYFDPIFTPRFSSLFNKRTKVDFSPSEINWQRPGQLSKNPCLVSNNGFDNIKIFGGRLSPEWFPVLFALLKEKDLIDLVIPDLYSQNSFNQNASAITPNKMIYCGAFLFKFRRGGVIEDVVIDDFLPTTIHGHLLTAISSDIDEFLPALLEKAYAKFLGGYYNLLEQHYLTALMDFTGGLVESISMRGQELLTMTEMESLYVKLNTMVGTSFAICEVSREHQIDDSPRSSFDLYLINSTTKIPPDPPDTMMSYVINSFGDKNGDLVPLVRMRSLLQKEATDLHISGRQLNEKWNECSTLVRTQYGVIYSDPRESWVSIEELPHVCNQIILIHFLYRNPILALAKKQEYWKYFFFENFWRRDDPRGDVDLCGELFLRNQQYLCIVNETDGCNMKIALTNIQKYVDSGANAIQKERDLKTGITILEVERNRQYRLHNLRLTRVIPCHIDSRIDRTCMISVSLELGRYVIIPWISAGTGTRYTLQMFSSAANTDFSHLSLESPRDIFCMSCSFSRSIVGTKNSLNSIYRAPSTQSSRDYNESRRISSPNTNSCKECAAICPKRATRISVLCLEILESVDKCHLPPLYFSITCEEEKFQSRPLMSSSNHQWNEHFIFFRFSPSNSNGTIKIFTEGTLGVKSILCTHTFSEKELREDGNFYVYVSIPSSTDKSTIKCRLVTDIKNYLPSEFHLA